MARAYAGIGSRRTDESRLALMGQAAARLAERGYVLRSGAADGADSAFEQGAALAGGAREIYLPWAGFSGRFDGRVLAKQPGYGQALEIAAPLHPAWDRLSDAVRRLMARNVMQVLGANCDDPVQFVLCWAPKPKFDAEGRVRDVDGGTGLAVRLAHARGIDVFHLDVPDHLARITAFCAPLPEFLHAHAA